MSTESATTRTCQAPGCGADISHKRRHARYCDRTCKVKASDNRRIVDGRSRTRDRARYEREREHRIRYARNYYWLNVEVARQYSRKYRAANPEKRTAQSLRRRAREYGADCREVNRDDLHRLLVIADFRCTYCREKKKLVWDHVIPLARGGRHAIGNLAPACVTCNSSKNDLLLSEWRHNRLAPIRR